MAALEEQKRRGAESARVAAPEEKNRRDLEARKRRDAKAQAKKELAAAAAKARKARTAARRATESQATKERGIFVGTPPTAVSVVVGEDTAVGKSVGTTTAGLLVDDARTGTKPGRKCRSTGRLTTSRRRTAVMLRPSVRHDRKSRFECEYFRLDNYLRHSKSPSSERFLISQRGSGSNYGYWRGRCDRLLGL